MIYAIIKWLIEWGLAFYFITTINQVFKKDKYSKRTKLILFMECFVFFLPSFISKDLFPLNTICIFVIYALISIFTLKISILKSLIEAFCYIIYLFLCEMLSLTIVLYFMELKSAEQLLLHENGQLIMTLTHYVINFLGIFVTGFILRKKEEFSQLTKFFVSKQFLTFILLIILTFIPQIVLIAYNRYDYNIIFLIFNILQILVLSVYMVYSIYTYLQKEKFKEENTELETDNKSMVSLIDGVRTIKHDFNNIFQAINGYICVKDYDKLETYVASVMKECNMLNTITFLNKDVFDDPGIYGVVGSKHFYANSIGINFEIDVTAKISSLNFSKSELCRIFGIILDNAIEATNKTSNKYVKLEIHFDKLKNAKIIRVYNTYDKSANIDLSKIYDKGYSSKKVKSGIGLWEVKRLISNNKKSQIYATIENDMFIQNIIIED